MAKHRRNRLTDHARTQGYHQLGPLPRCPRCGLTFAPSHMKHRRHGEGLMWRCCCGLVSLAVPTPGIAISLS